MKNDRTMRLMTTLLLAGGLLLGGCASESEPKKAGENPAETAAQKTSAKPADKGAAQLWAENCSRCHNARSPSSYSDAQWEVIGHHMRVRGYLTGEEQRTIVEFLKAGN
jgi:hypothetical protein